MSVLRVEGLTGGYGPVAVLHDVSFEIPEGEVVAMLGANGAGKTTTLRALSGLLPGARGSVTLGDEELLGRNVVDVAARGVAHVPEGRGTIIDLTVEENLRVGGYLRPSQAEVRETIDYCFGTFPVLHDRRNQKAGSLSGGEQQMLAVSRALMMRPRLILLDEPSLGLAPTVIRTVFEALGTISREQGTSMFVVEQNASLALNLATRAYVIESGQIVLSGDSATIGNDDALRRAYLGY